MLEMEQTYLRLLSVIEASLELAEGALSSLNTPNVQHRLKLVKYFPSEANNNNLQTQGVGVHQDKTGWLTFVQEVDTPGLEVHLKHSHCWTEARLDTGTWAINIGYEFTSTLLKYIE
jgi:isopenicillin N synthase-like dioxygenase